MDVTLLADDMLPVKVIVGLNGFVPTPVTVAINPAAVPILPVVFPAVIAPVFVMITGVVNVLTALKLPMMPPANASILVAVLVMVPELDHVPLKA